MKKFIFSLAYIAVSILLVSCEIDNYEGPDGTLTGSVTDAMTGNPIQTEQPNGFRIKYEELSWSETSPSQYFWGRPDGTYRNTKLFDGHYRIAVVEGAFLSPESQEIDIRSGNVTTVNFTVTPYLSFSNVSVVKAGESNVKVTFTINRNIPSAALRDYQIFASSKTPYVGRNEGASESAISKGSTTLTEANLGVPIEVILNNYVAGKTYYIRIGASCVNPSNRYNMTEVFKIQF